MRWNGFWLKLKARGVVFIGLLLYKPIEGTVEPFVIFWKPSSPFHKSIELYNNRLVNVQLHDHKNRLEIGSEALSSEAQSSEAQSYEAQSSEAQKFQA